MSAADGTVRSIGFGSRPSRAVSRGVSWPAASVRILRPCRYRVRGSASVTGHAPEDGTAATRSFHEDRTSTSGTISASMSSRIGSGGAASLPSSWCRPVVGSVSSAWSSRFSAGRPVSASRISARSVSQNSRGPCSGSTVLMPSSHRVTVAGPVHQAPRAQGRSSSSSRSQAVCGLELGARADGVEAGVAGLGWPDPGHCGSPAVSRPSVGSAAGYDRKDPHLASARRVAQYVGLPSDRGLSAGQCPRWSGTRHRGCQGPCGSCNARRWPRSRR
jgi:hypothetical protein